ncbi:MAG: ureidoglycolate lyase [Victivallales bacterium]|nr:ureidoglycolate lyase [Victivallales bacterium]
MKTLTVQELSIEKFARYGQFADMLNPGGDFIGKKPLAFFRDMLQQNLKNPAISYSILHVSPRRKVIDVSEYHDDSAEMFMPLDSDVIAHVAPADCGPEVPVEKIELFRVPKGTMVILRPGVWHHAPFVPDGETASVLIALPERLYMTDCKVVDIPPAKHIIWG